MDLNFWIDPEGNFIELGGYMHNQYATDLLDEEMSLEERCNFFIENHKYPYEILHGRGWIRVRYFNGKLKIFGNNIDLETPMRNTMEPSMNIKQIETAKELCSMYNTTLFNAINDEKFIKT